MSRYTGFLRDSIGTQQTFCDSQGQIEGFAAVSAMLLFACLSGSCRAFFVSIGWSLCGSHGQLWLGSRVSLRSGHVLAMLAPGQALCQHFVVQMICKTPDTSWT